MRLVAIVVVGAACGRLGFDASTLGANGDARGDTNGDGVSALGCAAKSYELCDGFEDGAFAPVWIVEGATLDTTVAHRGQHSAHVHIPSISAGTASYSDLDQTTTLALGDTTFYVRAYVLLGGLPAATNAMELITAETPNAEDAIFLRSTQLDVYEQFPPEMATDNMTVPPVGSWFCVLFTVTRSKTSGTLTLAGDVPGATLSGVPTDGTPTLHDMRFGLQLAATNCNVDQPALDAWIDDVLVDRAPVTCAD